MDNDVTIQLSRGEYNSLLLLLGYATGAAVKDDNLPLAYSFLRLTNAVNRNNPDFIAYEVPPVSE